MPGMVRYVHPLTPQFLLCSFSYLISSKCHTESRGYYFKPIGEIFSSARDKKYCKKINDNYYEIQFSFT